MPVDKFYRLYGLSVAADGEISGLRRVETRTNPDLTLHIGSMPASVSTQSYTCPVYSTPHSANNRPNLLVDESVDRAYTRFAYADGVTFVVCRRGYDIWMAWRRGLHQDDAFVYLLGPVMGYILRLRGKVPLHASAISILGRAFGLSGSTGAGKSTTAAYLTRRGCSVLCDDLLALDDHVNGFRSQPGYPRMRLWPSSSEALFGSQEHLPRITPNWDKRYFSLEDSPGAFEPLPQELRAIYILAERSNESKTPYIEGLTAQEAYMELVTNTYVNYLLDAQMRALEFEVLGRLVKQVPVRRVTPHSEISRLPLLCDRILEDFQNITSAARAA